MVSERELAARDRAVRQLLVQQVHRDTAAAGASRPVRRPSVQPGGVGRWRGAVVTAVVLVAVVAGSSAVLQAVRPAVPRPGGSHPAGIAEPSLRPAPTSPAPQASRPLIAKRGAQQRSRAELHAAVQADPTLRDKTVWEQQAWLNIQCMAGKGFLYDPVAEMAGGEAGAADDGLTAAQRHAFDVALYGPDPSGPYNWRTAGCDGLAVHATGQDDAH